MDEKRLISHANNYIKQMAKGVNPLTGKNIPDSDLINNVKISRCLFYVSEVLDKYSDVLEKGNKSRSRKSKFYATSEELANFSFSNEPIYVSILADKINQCVQKEEMRKLSATSISNWLVSRGFLIAYTREDGKASKKPTSLGEELGIKTITKDGKNGPYMINTYNINAQRFIIENIEDISKSIQ